MKSLLAPENAAVLADIASSNALLAFDYDGTLAPTAAHPAEAFMRPGTCGLLEQLGRAYPCVVITGRSQTDALHRMRGAGVFEVIGNHGREPWRRREEGPNKGRAFELAHRSLGCDAALYVGDDETDEEVFRLDNPSHLITVRVGRKASSNARFFIPDQQSIDILLERLLTLRVETRRPRISNLVRRG